MDIKASLVKELREITGAGMLDCKKALQECNGDMDLSIDYLREKGISKAAKKADRIAAEGLASIFIDGNKAVILEINSETDFVAKNEEFKNLVSAVGNALINSDAASIDEALRVNTDNGTIEEVITSLTATIGEKISLRRFEIVTKSDEEVFGSYLHMGGKIASLIVASGSDETVAKDVAMQSAAMRPEYIAREEVPEEKQEKEKNILREQVLSEGKPQEIVEKIITGKMEKFYEEICLIEQVFVKDNDLKVIDYLKNNNMSVSKMIRFEVGEGMEKRSDNFRDEVRSQLENA